ncbi:Wadjet anti-phage system protein JetD domain-containing protein [Atopobiaceae bacterium 24-176]
MADNRRYLTFGEVRFSVLRHFEARRFSDAAAPLCGGEPPVPFSLALGAPTQQELSCDPEAWLETADELDRGIAEARLPHTTVARTNPVTGSPVELPDALTGLTPDDVARLSGPFSATLSRLRTHARAFLPYRPFSQAEAEELLCLSERWDRDELSLLLAVADWFLTHDPTGLTARQLPIDGLGSKWLDDADHRRCVLLLTHRRSLGLSERERVWQWRLLDPAWAESPEHPRFAFALAGDAPWEPPYRPSTVIVSENRDSMEAFPLSVPGAVCLWGHGSAAPLAFEDLPWLAAADRIFYWGDIDAAGLEIADRFLAAAEAHCARTSALAMDGATYRRFSRYGVDVDEGTRRAAHLDSLDGASRILYKRLCSKDCPGPRRVEQEKVPYEWVLSQLAEQGGPTTGAAAAAAGHGEAGGREAAASEPDRRAPTGSTVAVRLSAEQAQLIREAAQAADMGMESYLRAMALDAANGWE